jgi:RNA polymerase sigma factor (sigma-70 family)
MEDVTPNSESSPSQDSLGFGPGEQLKAFRWTQALARRLVRDPALAADLNQDAWTRVLERFGNSVPSRRWLAQTLRSLAFRARRGNSRRAHHEALSAPGKSLPSASELIERNEAQRRVAAAVLELPGPLRDVLLLRFQEGIRVSAIATRLGCAKSTVSERLQRGLAALRQQLGEAKDGSGWDACCLIATPFGLAGSSSLPLPLTQAVQSTTTAAMRTQGSGVAAKSAALPYITGMTFFMSKLTTIGSVLAALALATVGLWTRGGDAAESSSASASGDELDVTLIGPKLSVEAPALHSPTPLNALPDDLATRSAVPQAFDPEKHYVVVGRVVREDGEPVPNTTVRLHFRDEMSHTTQGTEDGQFELIMDLDAIESIPELRSLSLDIVAERYLTMHSVYIPREGDGVIAMPSLGARDDVGTITLFPAGAIQGRVLSSTGEAVAGAVIDLFDHDPEDMQARWSYSGHEPEVISDANGNFLMGHILGKTIKLSAGHKLFIDSDQFEVVTVTSGQTTSGVTLFVTPAAIVSGRVEDTDGDPINDAYVNGTGNWSIMDTVHSDENGRFRLALRDGSPAVVAAYVPGMTQVSPEPDQKRGAGELTIVMRPDLPSGAFTVQIVDAQNGKPIRRAGVARIEAGDERVGADAKYEGELPASKTVPMGGIRVDYVPGSDYMLAAAEGYLPRLFPTTEHAQDAPQLTLGLKKRPGIRGRLLLDGKPLIGERVYLSGVDLHIATPREALSSGRVQRAETDRSILETIKRNSYSPEYVLGLDGIPPAHHLVEFGRDAGARLDAHGRFLFEDTEKPLFFLSYTRVGKSERILGPFERQKEGTDLGDIEIATPATLTGQFHARGAWEAKDYVIRLEGPERIIPVDSAGWFRLENLDPGDIYFQLRPGDDAAGERLPSAFEDLPVYHLVLAAGEFRHVELDLDTFFECQLDLRVTIAGNAPPPKSRIRLSPLDDPTREFELSTKVDGTSVRARTRALGACRIDLTVMGALTGYGYLRGGENTLDLQAAITLKDQLEIEAGTLRFVLPASPWTDALKSVNLELEPLDGRASATEIYGIKLRGGVGAATTGAAEERFGETIPIAPGRYQVRLRNNEERKGLLASFEVEIESNQRTDVRIPF